MYGRQTQGHKHETIIAHHYRVAGHKKESTIKGKISLPMGVNSFILE